MQSVVPPSEAGVSDRRSHPCNLQCPSEVGIHLCNRCNLWLSPSETGIPTAGRLAFYFAYFASFAVNPTEVVIPTSDHHKKTALIRRFFSIEIESQ